MTQPSPWRKSSRSGSQPSGSCVETRLHAERFQVRDSKLGDASPVLSLTAEDFTGLLTTVSK
ncbi:MAG: DUF397 domain-containing protein [Stackebrandtia sp.]